MKQLELTPPLLIITMGLPGSGKSFFGRQFAEQYGLPRISQDVLRFELFEKPQFNDDEADIIERIFYYILSQVIVSGQNVVCEGGYLKTKQRKKLLETAKKYGYRTLTVWLQTDLETSMKRASTRDRRNPDSKYAFEIDKMTFNRIKTTLQRPSDKEPFVVISGKHAFKGQCLAVLRKITSMYSAGLLNGNFTAPKQRATNSAVVARTRRQRFVQ